MATDLDSSIAARIAPLQVDDLFVLVGSNPLPNAVAARLLTRPSGRVHLIYTDQTDAIANHLGAWVENDSGMPCTVSRVRVSDHDGQNIYRGVLAEAGQYARKSASIGLHYTGGTKAMSVHAHRAVADVGKAEHLDPVFTYLDARQLRLCVDASAGGISHPTIPIATAVHFTIKALIRLHGWTFQSTQPTAAKLLDIATVLAQICQEKAGQSAWRTWIHEVLEKCCREKEGKGDWKTDAKLRRVTLDWPSDPILQPVVTAFQRLTGTSGATIDVGELAGRSGYHQQEKKVCRWLHGVWLESYVLGAVKKIEEMAGLDETQANLNIARPDGQTPLELDVAAIRGYQFFGISCSTSVEKGILKTKLFEIETRARQLGGDEARVALVCFTTKPDVLEKELVGDFGGNRNQVRVFGAADLLDLPNKLAEWIQKSATGGN